MDHRDRTILASVGVVLIFVAVQVGAIALVEPFQQEGYQSVEDSEDPSLSIFYLLAILVVTALMLVALKYGGQSILRLFIISSGAYIAFYVFQVLAPALVTVSVGGFPLDVFAIVAALGLGAVLYFHPEWYVIDAAGIIMGIGAAGLFGVNLNVFPVIVLLVGLAVYDAISVYGTEHMLTLASGVMEMRVPVVLVVPLSLSYSFLEETGPETLEQSDEDTDDQDANSEESAVEDGSQDDAQDEALDAERLRELGPDGIADLDSAQFAGLEADVLEELDEDLREAIETEMPERDALFIGLGDAVMPTILVASAAFFVDAGTVSLLGITTTVPALTAMVGTLAGLVVLLWLVTKGRAHAGLPLLNGGAIAGYLLGALISGLTLLEALGISGYL